MLILRKIRAPRKSVCNCKQNGANINWHNGRQIMFSRTTSQSADIMVVCGALSGLVKHVFFNLSTNEREMEISASGLLFFFILSLPLLLLPVLQFSFSQNRSVNHATKPLSTNIKYVYCHVMPCYTDCVFDNKRR